MVPHEVQRALMNVAENVTNEVQRSIDFFSATSAAPSPSTVYLSGGTARLAPLVGAIESRIDVPVEVVDPFRNLDTSKHDTSYLRSLGPTAAVVIGLGLRYPGDN